MPTAFISHTHADASIARQIQRVLREMGVDTLDMESIPAGANVNQAINDMLKRADGYVFVVSPQFARSEWANVELAAAVADTTSGFAKPIVPILVGDVDPGRDLPELLRRYRWLDLRAGISPELLAGLATSLKQGFGQDSTTAQLDAEEEFLKLRQSQLALERAEYVRRRAGQEAQASSRLSRLGVLAAVLGFGVGLVSLIIAFGVVGDARGAAFGIAGLFVGAALNVLADRLLLSIRRRSGGGGAGSGPEDV